MNHWKDPTSDQRHVLGCKAVGMLVGIVSSGALDHLPTIKQMAIDLDAEWVATLKPAPSPATELRAHDGTHVCPHGESYGECNACDVAGDHAFDAAREDRIFGR